MTEENETKKTKRSIENPLTKLYAVIVVLIACLGVSIYFNLNPTAMIAADGNGGDGTGNGEDRVPIESPYTTFKAVSGDICMEEGKPVVYLFSTTSCPHCKWIKDTFDSVIGEYIAEEKIVAYHWEINTDDNTLTDDPEIGIPTDHMEIYGQFNGGGYVPTFVFGCKYHRVGNGYEGEYTSGALTSEEALQEEEAEFRQIIEDMLSA